MKRHVIQSDLWAKFKKAYGTPAVKAGGIWYTKHKIPFTNNFYAYSARCNPFEIDFNELKTSLEENDCVAVHLDVPNITIDSDKAADAVELLKAHCVVSGRDEFAKGNFLLDISKSEEELLANMHKKHRYNIRYATRAGVTVEKYSKEEDFETFFKIYNDTGERQGYFTRKRSYLKKLWDIFYPEGKADILIANYKGEPLAAWFVFIYDDVLYYPYGGSLTEHKNLQASCLLGWEIIRYGKEKGCTLFDMWGAADSMEDPTDSYYGFSLFKKKFGADHVQYIDSYDYVINPAMYKMFTTANSMRWKLLKLMK